MPFECLVSDCGKRFKVISDLIQHKAIHSNEMQFKCNVKDCDQSLGNYYHLNDHKNKINCDKSSKIFNYDKNYEEIHYRKKFCCNRCDKTFDLFQHLIQHLNTNHSKLKPFVCHLNGCNKAFKRRHQLISHKYLFHYNNRKFVNPVSVYPKDFISNGELNAHKSIDSNIMTNKLYINSQNCINNYKIVKVKDYKIKILKVEYTCLDKYCGQIFYNDNDIKNHIIRCHSSKFHLN